MPNILEVQNLVKHYGDFQAVKGVSFSIKEGEIFSLLGSRAHRDDGHGIPSCAAEQTAGHCPWLRKQLFGLLPCRLARPSPGPENRLGKPRTTVSIAADVGRYGM